MTTTTRTVARRSDHRTEQLQSERTTGSRRRFPWLATAQIAAVGVFLLPILWMYVSSLRPSLDIQGGSIIPTTLTLSNYVNLFGLGIVPRAFLNSAIVAAASALISTTVAVAAAYAIDRFRFRARTAVSGLLLAGQLVPGLVILVPFVIALRQLGLGDTLIGVAIAHITIGIPIAVLLLQNYIADIPPALEEAAIVDGCSRVGALWRIVLPLLRPALSAVFSFSFILSWGEYVLALSLITSDQNKTLPLAMQSLFQLYGVDLGLVMAFGVVISLPVAVLFMFIQRSFVSNLTSGGVK